MNKKGCREAIKDSWWNFCGETDMGQTLPVLCKRCGGEFDLEDDVDLVTEGQKVLIEHFASTYEKAAVKVSWTYRFKCDCEDCQREGIEEIVKTKTQYLYITTPEEVNSWLKENEDSKIIDIVAYDSFNNTVFDESTGITTATYTGNGGCC